MMKKLLPTLFVFAMCFFTASQAYGQTYVDDPYNCPTTFSSQTCAISGEVLCGFDSNILFCFDASSITTPNTTTTSTRNISSSFDGGYIIDCESYDGTIPFCDNNGNFECDRNETTYGTLFRQTVCTANIFGKSTASDCRSGFYDCFGDDEVCESTSTSACSEGGSNNSYTTATCSIAYGENPTNATCVCDSTAFTCDGEIDDANGCEFVEDDSCGFGTGVVDSNSTSQCVDEFTANCISSGTLDCNNDDSDTITSTCNGGIDGCEIVIGDTCTTSNGLSGTYSSICSDSDDGLCIADASYFETGTETKFSSTNPLLWGIQYGTGLLLNMTNIVTGFSFIVDNDDNVGIGIDADGTISSILHVNSNAVDTTPIITIENIGGDIQIFRTDVSPESRVSGSVGDIAIDSINGIMYIKEIGSSDNFGWKKIESSITMTLIDDDLDTQIQVEENVNENKIRFDTAGSERMIIDNSGLVGIGTSFPNHLLSVNGIIESISGGFKFPDETIQTTASTGDIEEIIVGIGLLGGGTIGNVKLDVDTLSIQSRVTDSCSIGSSIRTINLDGTVACETDDIGDSIPIGTILPYAGSTIPTGWLKCNGSEMNRTTYADLYTSIGTNWGNGDGSTTFHLPDLRGMFLRGVDEGVGNDPDRNNRTASHSGGNSGDQVGSLQENAFTIHDHSVDLSDSVRTNNNIHYEFAGSDKWKTDALVLPGITSKKGGSSETRPINANVMYIIKY